MKRRSFLKRSAAVSAGAMFLPNYAHGQTTANEKVNLAVIGCSYRGGTIGGQAIGNSLTNCVALCDVLPSRTDGLQKKCGGGVPVYDDFREMFDKMGDKIDACTVGVPDHAHFPITMLAMSLGISVYVEKPLAHTFEECELLMAAEEKYKVACQMGNQGHSAMQRVQFETWVNAGLMKNVRRVDACMNKGRRWHPWGDVQEFPAEEKMPEGMNWDVWAGTAPLRPYNGKYDPGNWRGWYDYGNGAFGDWGPHTLDTVHRYLNLGLPKKIRAEKVEKPNSLIFPYATTIAFDFAERGPGMPEMTINWYDGPGNRPPQEPQLAGKNIPTCGKAIYSDELTFIGSTHSSSLSIVSATSEDVLKDGLPDLPTPDTSTSHMDNFIRAAAGIDPRCNSCFAVSAPLTQVFMLGCIAQRLGEDLEFDTEKKRITNNDRADALLKGNAPRKGWEEYYKLA